ncbi:hypothetical protein DEI86_15140 [Curtobacterium sp. MCBD17_028]|nr:hypothetical protein DEI86_15140 [Curtobacterium sp. MCBD17_028]
MYDIHAMLGCRCSRHRLHRDEGQGVWSRGSDMEPGTLDTVVVEELTAEQGRAMVDEAVRETLGIPLETFRARLEAGAYDGTDDDQIIRLILMLPFAD